MKYKNEASQLSVITGKVKTILENKAITLEVEYFDTKGQHTEEVTIQTNDTSKARQGFGLTAVGYGAGPNKYSAEIIMNGSEYFEKDGLAVITGFISKAGINQELNEDNSPKLNKEGVARKPHYDISLRVKEGEKYVTHRIKIYNSEKRPDAIEIAQKKYGNIGKEFTKDGVTTVNAMVGTFITRAGNSYTMTAESGEYHYCDHLGLIKDDFEYKQLPVKEKTAEKAPEETQAQAEQAQDNLENDGFINIPDGIDEELPFN